MSDAKKCLLIILIFGVIEGLMSCGIEATPFQQLFIYGSFAILVGGAAVFKFGFRWGLSGALFFSIGVLIAGANVIISMSAMVGILLFSFGTNYIIGIIGKFAQSLKG